MGALIGISGQAGVGKTTAANIFVNLFNIVEISFADPIKRAAKEWWDFSDEQLWGPSKNRNAPDPRYRIKPNKESDLYNIVSEDLLDLMDQDIFSTVDIDLGTFLSPRMALQGIGDGIRQIDPQVWLRHGLKLATQIVNNPSLSYSRERGVYHTDEKVNGVVFSDCRYTNEMKEVKAAGGKLIRIKRPNAGLTGSYSAHPSEMEQLSVPDDFFDVVIDNVNSLQDFCDDIIKVGLDFGLPLTVEEKGQLEFKW